MWRQVFSVYWRLKLCLPLCLSPAMCVCTSAVCPLKPVSSVFLHFLPCLSCERGTFPLHSRSMYCIENNLRLAFYAACSQVTPVKIAQPVKVTDLTCVILYLIIISLLTLFFDFFFFEENLNWHISFSDL